MARPRTSTTSSTARGLGIRHRQQRARLLARHVDGSPCYWCGQPMFRDPARNWDGRPLEADHSLARSAGGTVADRLLCSTCNRQRGDGSRDHLRPAVTGKPLTEARSDLEHAADRRRWTLLDWGYDDTPDTA